MTLDIAGATVAPLGLNKEQEDLYKFCILGSRRGKQLQSRHGGAYRYGQAVADSNSYFNLMKAKSDDRLFPFTNPSMGDLESMRNALDSYISNAQQIVGYNDIVLANYNPQVDPNEPDTIPAPVVAGYASVLTHLLELRKDLFGSGVQVGGNVSRNLIQHTSLLSGVDQVPDGEFPSLPGINGIMQSNNQIRNGLGQNFKDVADSLLNSGLNEGSGAFQKVSDNILTGIAGKFSSVLEGVDFIGPEKAQNLIASGLEKIRPQLNESIASAFEGIGTFGSEEIGPLADQVIGSISGSLTGIVDGAIGPVNDLLNLNLSASDLVEDAMNSVIGGLSDGGIPDILDNVSSIFGGEGLGSDLGSLLGDAPSMINDVVNSAFGGDLLRPFEGLTDNFSSAFTSILPDGLGKISDMASGLVGDVVNFDIGGNLTNILDPSNFNVSNLVSNFGQAIPNMGDLVGGLNNLVDGSIPGLGDMIGDVSSMISGDLGSFSDAMALVDDFSLGGVLEGMSVDSFSTQILDVVGIDAVKDLSSVIPTTGVPSVSC